ncbi:MAG: DUF4907 domain-containing protein [Parafilimonas sp.]|nr:DUF4907 domain-containing protein [Parafilimonas sp.]
MKNVCRLLLCLVLIFAFNRANSQSIKKDTTFNIISSANKTYGYNVLINNKIFIHQTNIPGMQGNEGFKKRTQAEKAAQLVIDKIKQGIMPPTLSQNEIDKILNTKN